MIRLRRLAAVLREKRGFTLIEVLLGMTVSTIILISIAVVSSTFYLNYVNSIETSYTRIMATNIADAVKDQLATAWDVSCTSDSVTYLTEFGQKTISGGPNPKIEGLTYDPNYYMSKNAELSFSEDGGGTFTVTVTITNKVGNNLKPYVMTRKFNLLNVPTSP